MVVTKLFELLSKTIKAKIQWLSQRFSNHSCSVHLFTAFQYKFLLYVHVYNVFRCPQGFHRIKAKNL